MKVQLLINIHLFLRETHKVNGPHSVNRVVPDKTEKNTRLSVCE